MAFFQKQAPHLKPELLHEGFSQTRLKAKLAVRPGPEIGLFERGSHKAISIPECLVHHPAINRAVHLIRAEIIAQKLSIFQENPPVGFLRYLQFFVQRETGRVQLVLTLNLYRARSGFVDLEGSQNGPNPQNLTARGIKENCPEVDRFCRSLLKKDLWHSIWLNFHPEASNRILGNTWELIYGEPFLWQTFNGETAVAFHPGAFSQVHFSLFEKMLRKIDQWVPLGAKIVEFYAGTGAIGLSLRKKAVKIDLVENNPYANLSFQESLLCLSPSERALYTYWVSDGEKCLELLEENSLIIVDPPRKGVEEALLERLCCLKNVKLIYISCCFESFQKNCTRLLDAGWELIDISGYLLFPGTNHIEILGLLTKGS